MSDNKRNESFLPDQGRSETAATVGKKLYGASGAMSYRVTIMTGAGMVQPDIVADTGDEAAETALKRFMGGKVVHVEPTPQEALAA